MDKTIYDVVASIRHYSRFFVKLAYAKEDDPEILEAIRDINELKVDTSYPFLMEIFNDYSKGMLTKEDVLSVMRLIESYVFRRAICGIPTNSLNKTFANLTKEIDKENYLESVKAAFVLKEGYKRLPNDEEFRSLFPQAPIYNLRITDYTLRKLENFERRKEPISVENYTVEHIMPQNLSEMWNKELGEEGKKIHEKYLHTIGNLTLTGYNSELGYLPFKEKRDLQGGFGSSPLWLNSTLANLESWNRNEIERRAKELTDRAVRIWPMPDLQPEILQKYRAKEEAGDSDLYTEEDHFENGSDHTVRLYETIKPTILSIASDIRLVPKKKYIAFTRNNKNFVDIVFYRSQLNLYLNIKKGRLHDPNRLAKDVSPPGHGHWGNGDYLLVLRNLGGTEDILPLVTQSYKGIENS